MTRSGGAYRDRAAAGRRLATELEQLRGRGVVVLGLPRGGVPVAFEVATALDAALDVVVVRKVGVPYQPELAMGAVAEGGVRVVDPDIVHRAGVTEAEYAAVERQELATVRRRVQALRGGRPPVPLLGRTVVLVDDGVATGSTAEAACRVVRAAGAGQVVLATPVASAEAVRRLRSVADEVVCPLVPRLFAAIGQFYVDFSPVPDAEVAALLDRAAARRPAPAVAPAHTVRVTAAAGGATVTGADAARAHAAGADAARAHAAGADAAGADAAGADAAGVDAEVAVRAGSVWLPGHLTVPAGSSAVVLFAHGSGSSRNSPRNRFVASVLSAAGLGTLLFDLLTETEAADRSYVFDIPLLASRLAEATDWVRTATERGSSDPASWRIGYFGASTGAAAALWAAADLGTIIGAVVSRGGRPDLAATRLADVRAPTLLIVGSLDRTVLGLNRAAQAWLPGENKLAVVPGATHLFEEPGTLRAAAELARDWFVQHLAGSAAHRATPLRRHA